jgi:hypothetical protein
MANGTHILKLEIALPLPRLRTITVSTVGARKVVFIPNDGESGSAAYLVTLEGARRLLRNLQTMVDVYDGQAFGYWRSGLVVHHVLPLPAKQTGESEIARPVKKAKASRFARKRAKLVRTARSVRESALKLAFRVRRFGVKPSFVAAPY